MTSDEREDFEERCALVADGNNISQDEATTIVQAWRETVGKDSFPTEDER
jgi:hypothetical protein